MRVNEDEGQVLSGELLILDKGSSNRSNEMITIMIMDMRVMMMDMRVVMMNLVFESV